MQQIDLDPAAVHSLGDKSSGSAEVVQPAVKDLSDGWLPKSQPEFKSTLELCRQKWIFTFVDLDDALTAIGDKLHASANAVTTGDTTSADQF
ncbi:MAG: hypothetical protein GEV10_00945 [Streptosporangiales bacterium]|nr:hypothetical protein [Streptosporangiales bacterium]